MLDTPLGHLLGDYMIALESRLADVTEADFSGVKMTTDKALAALRGVGGIILRSLFDETKEEALRAALGDLRAVTTESAG